jgi:rod shape-determining protein MreD
MRWIADVIWMCTAVLVYLSYGPVMSIFGMVPILPVIVLVRVSLTGGRLAGNLIGFLCGALLDIFSLPWYGAHMLVDSILGFVLGAVRNHIVIDNLLVRTAVLLTAATVHSVCVLFVKSFAGNLGPDPYVAALGSAVYTAIAGAIWWGLTDVARSIFGMQSLWHIDQ